jgi:acetyl esterase
MQTLKVLILRLYYRLLNWWAWRGSDFSDIHTENLTIEGSQGSIPARQYRSAGKRAQALLVYFHGGGWVIGDLRTHDPFCKRLAAETGATVVAIDYRLAPEHLCPAAAIDCIDATRWLTRHRDEIGLGGAPVFVAGDSAGGNLAAIVANESNEPYTSELRGQVLIYPVTRHYNPPTPSYVENGTGHGLTRELMEWFWDTYLGQAVTPTGEAARLSTPQDHPPPPGTSAALVITAGLDPLRDEGADYARALDNAGVRVMHELYMAEEHGFACSDGMTPGHKNAMNLISKWMEEQCTQAH